MLLEKGYHFRDACMIIGKDSEVILEKLEEGKTVDEMLFLNHSGSFYEHIAFFLQFVSLQEAIKMTFTYLDFEENMKRQFLRKSLYPFFIFLCAVMTLLFFRGNILPMMQSGFELEQDASFLQVVLDFLYILAILLLLGLSVLLFYLLIYRLVPRFHHNCMLLLIAHCRWVKDYWSYQFCAYLRILMQGGLSSKQVFSFLRTNGKKKMIAECAKRIEALLENGASLTDALAQCALLSKDLLQMIEIGSAASTLDTLLGQYLIKHQMQMEKRIKSCTIAITALAYGYVAVLVISVYQIMLLPLELLEQF